MGVLYGKRQHLKRLHPYKVRPNTDNIPNCWEWGTLRNYELIAGIKACVDYWKNSAGARTLRSRPGALRSWPRTKRSIGTSAR